MSVFEKIVQKIKIRWLVKIWISILFLSASITFLTFLVFQLYSVSEVLLFFVFLLAVLFSFFLLKRELPTKRKILTLIDHQVENMEYSSFLVATSPQTRLEKIQKKKVLHQISSQMLVKIPLNSGKILFTLTTGILLTTASFIPAFIPEYSKGKSDKKEFFVSDTISVGKSDSIYLVSQKVHMITPLYTGIGTKILESKDITIPEQSKIRFELDFSIKPKEVWIKFSNGDSIPEETYYTPEKSGFYTLHFLDHNENEIASPYYQLIIENDEPPVVSINGIPQFQQFRYDENKKISFNTSIHDDYGIADAFITATITKGSGEAIKFREQRIDYDQKVSGRSAEIKTTFSVDQFDMEPGNEFYFYVTAIDNKKPVAQYTKTETYFFVIEDTAHVEFSLQGNLGVDIMPDYFRSQLQIIIDSEKLLKEKSSITKEEFNKKSNELAFDQKQLRLKYGQFIGEESESGIVAAREGAPQAESENVMEEFGHDHDHENEEGQHLDRAVEPSHDHHDHGEESEQETSTGTVLMEEFVHSHEDRETATFYSQSLKSKLKEALNEMWDSELYLRLYDPKESLPYQYKALKLLREIRNHARIYVKRIGFDPPPINEEEHRLKKEVKDPYRKSFQEFTEVEIFLPSTRELVKKLSFSGEDKISNTFQTLLKKSGDEIAQLAIENPGSYLSELNQIKYFINRSTLDRNDIQGLMKLKRDLLRLLPDSTVVPGSPTGDTHPLVKSYIRELTQ